jgi:hypothetical protein
MDTDIRPTEQSDDALTSRGNTAPDLALRHRLVLCVLVAGVTLWIRVLELTPGASRRSRRERCSCGMTHR